MPYHGSSVYDDDDFFLRYIQKRSKGNAPNELLEYPIIKEMVGNVEGKDVLELGCGDGQYGLTLLQAGAQRYHGIDNSLNMINAAKQNLPNDQVKLERVAVEDFSFTNNNYDLVISRLVFHYLANLEQVLAGIFDCLKSNGSFVLSVEHPIITSCYTSYHNNNKRGDWLVDNYFVPGARTNIWLEKEVVKHHRTLTEYFSLFRKAGLELIDLQESKPDKALFSSPEEYLRRSRVPLFLLMKWGKS